VNAAPRATAGTFGIGGTGGNGDGGGGGGGGGWYGGGGGDGIAMYGGGGAGGSSYSATAGAVFHTGGHGGNGQIVISYPVLGTPPSGSNMLLTGQQLTANGQGLISSNGAYRLQLNSDGNLVEYRQSDDAPMWQTGTSGTNATHAMLQGTGPSTGWFILANDAGTTIWQTANFIYTRPTVRLVLQDDGNLVLEDPSNYYVISLKSTLAQNQPLPNLHGLTSDNGVYTLYQNGPDLWVMNTATWAIQWRSGTQNTSASKTVLQSNGLLVVEDDAGKVYWGSTPNSVGNAPGDIVKLQNDGRLQLITAGGQVYWSSR
jgi:hypothetical protein